jgi:hypothetical protein
MTQVLVFSSQSFPVLHRHAGACEVLSHSAASPLRRTQPLAPSGSVDASLSETRALSASIFPPQPGVLAPTNAVARMTRRTSIARREGLRVAPRAASSTPQ